MNELQGLPNIGNVLGKQLMDIGIQTPKQLIQTGSREAWMRIRLRDPSACLNRLCALEGAIRGVHWHHLPQDVKDELREFYYTNRV